MKKCVACGEIKPLAEFPPSKGSTHSRCRPCKQEYDRDYHAKRTPEARRRKAAAHAVRRQRNRDYVKNYLADQSCIDCGENDPVVLDFDHLGDKLHNVSDMIRDCASLAAIAAEIAKCEIRCANCHRRVTATRRLRDVA